MSGEISSPPDSVPPGTPVVVSRAAHPVSRRMISNEALFVLNRLHKAGFYAYLAGGGVRDLLLGRHPKDFDVVTDAPPPQIKRLFHNCRLIGRRFRLAHVLFRDTFIEVATFRALVSEEEAATEPQFRQRDGLVLRDNVYGTPEEDARRRDFTVNALFYNIGDFSIIDYVGGLADLEARLLRVIGDPETRFREDPVRMLRAARFAAGLDLTLEPSARTALHARAGDLALVSKDRMHDELMKMFQGGHAEKILAWMGAAGLLREVFPAFAGWLEGRPADDPAHERFRRALRQLDVWQQAGLKPSGALLWAMLFGGYHESLAAELTRQGVPAAAALRRAALADLLAPTGRVRIPQRVANEAAHLLALQPLLRMHGRNAPVRLAARPEFKEALVYLKFAASFVPESREAVYWWTAYLASQRAAGNRHSMH